MHQQIFSRVAVLNLKNNCVKLFKTRKNKQETKFKTISFLLFLFLFLCLSQQCAKSSHQCLVVFQLCLNCPNIVSAVFQKCLSEGISFSKRHSIFFQNLFVNSKVLQRGQSFQLSWVNGGLGGKFKTYTYMRFVILNVRNPLLCTVQSQQ